MISRWNTAPVVSNIFQMLLFFPLNKTFQIDIYMSKDLGISLRFSDKLLRNLAAFHRVLKLYATEMSFFQSYSNSYLSSLGSL